MTSQCRRLKGIVCMLIFHAALTNPAKATDQQDLAVALRTLPLLTSKLINPVGVAIVYDPASVSSKTDAEKIKSIFDGGLEAPGDIKLTTLLVNAADMNGFSKTQIAILAQGFPSTSYSLISNASMGVLTIGMDTNCVRANVCVLGVTSKPHVDVYYSPVAADKAKISFASAFVMLAKQIGEHP